MAPMPFYADPNRFSTPVWQADPTQGWAQGQFIQQIPAQPALEGYPQQYSNGIYQATYQQAPGFESNTFYTGAVQVLARPPSASNQTQLATRPNGSYSHTPSPVLTQTQQNNQRNNISGQYQQEYPSNNQNYVPPPTTPTGGSVDSSQTGGISRPSSVNSAVNVPTNNQNFQTQHTGNFTPISSSNFSPVSNAGSSFVNSNMTTSSGNAIPGYPPVNSHPQLVSHNYSGGYPGNELSGQNSTTDNCHNKNSQQWTDNSDSHIWEQNGPSPQQICNKESAKSSSSEIQYQQNRTLQNVQIKSEDSHYNNQQNNEHKQTDHHHILQIPHDQSKENTTEMQFSQADRINLNSRLKTMILNKQQQQQLETNKMESQKIEHNKTGHFLSYSHHRQPHNLGDGGGFSKYPLSRDAVPQTYVNEINCKNVIKENQRPFAYSNQNFRFLESVHDKLNNFNSLDCELVKDKNFSKNQKFNDVLVSRTELTKQNNVYNKNEVNIKSEFNNVCHMGNVKSIDSNIVKTERIAQETSLQNQNRLTEIWRKSFLREKDNQSSPIKEVKIKEEKVSQKGSPFIKCTPETEKLKNNIVGVEIPPCNCLPHHQVAPEPGGYYTHLGCANNLASLRKDLEDRTGVNGKALRIEKILYTGKEGKTPQGCPIAKWIIRRTNYEEKYLIIAKQRPGHFCHSAIIVVCIVAWDGVLQGDADTIYSMLCEKLNKFGLPTNRRCATNEPRTCACQGLDPETCGASFSFGCSWSMYYNGCKFARSKAVRKFRLSVQEEEVEVEERLQNLATNLSPLYKMLAPQSFKNQCQYEHIASDCRLGLQPGRPFSGVTACLDFCAHSHKDTHNMNNGCTVVVTLTKHRGLSKPEDEQLHVLPLYVIDGTDEFGSRKDQEEKVVNGSIEVLHRYQCEVRVRNIPQPTCRQRANGKKRKDSQEKPIKGVSSKKEYTTPPRTPSNYNSPQRTPTKQLQSNHVSSTVLHHSDYSPMGYEYDNNLYYSPTSVQHSNKIQGQSSLHSKNNFSGVYYNNDSMCQNAQLLSNTNYYNNNKEALKSFPNNNKVSDNRINSSYDTVLQQDQPDTALNLTYPFLHNNNTVSHTTTATVTTNSPFYKSSNHKMLSTNVSQLQQNTALNAYNDTAKEYKYSDYYKNTPKLNSVPAPYKNDSHIFYNNNQNFIADQSKNVNSNLIWPNAIKKESPSNIPHSPNYIKKEPVYSPDSNLNSPSFPSPAYNYPNYPKTQNLPSFEYIKNPKLQPEYSPNFNSSFVCSNPFDDSFAYNPQNNEHSDIYYSDPYNYSYNNYSNLCSSPSTWFLSNNTPPHFGWSPPAEEPSKAKILGQVTDVIDNSQCFNDAQIGGVAIALSHGSVLFECAKHEQHATTALKNPNRKSPTRISLVFYQHRNLNRAKHGWEEHEEKQRLRKLDSLNIVANSNITDLELGDSKIPFNLLNKDDKAIKEIMMRAPTMTTITVTTVFPMYPCMVTGPYQEGVKGA